MRVIRFSTHDPNLTRKEDGTMKDINDESWKSAGSAEDNSDPNNTDYNKTGLIGKILGAPGKIIAGAIASCDDGYKGGI